MLNQNALAVMQYKSAETQDGKVELRLRLSLLDSSTSTRIGSLTISSKAYEKDELPNIYSTGLVWSPSGKWLAFYSECGVVIYGGIQAQGVRTQFWLVDLKCTGVTWLNDNQCYLLLDDEPKWKGATRKTTAVFTDVQRIIDNQKREFTKRPELKNTRFLSFSPALAAQPRIMCCVKGSWGEQMKCYIFYSDKAKCLEYPVGFFKQGETEIIQAVKWSSDGRLCYILYHGMINDRYLKEKKLMVVYDRDFNELRRMIFSIYDDVYDFFCAPFDSNFFVNGPFNIFACFSAVTGCSLFKTKCFPNVQAIRTSPKGMVVSVNVQKFAYFAGNLIHESQVFFGEMRGDKFDEWQSCQLSREYSISCMAFIPQRFNPG